MFSVTPKVVRQPRMFYCRCKRMRIIHIGSKVGRFAAKKRKPFAQVSILIAQRDVFRDLSTGTAVLVDLAWCLCPDKASSSPPFNDGGEYWTAGLPLSPTAWTFHHTFEPVVPGNCCGTILHLQYRVRVIRALRCWGKNSSWQR